jgi:RNA polymerase sigma factor (sigma-70 family)
MRLASTAHETPVLHNDESDSQSKDEALFMDRFYLSHRTEFLKWSYKTYGLQPETAIDIYQDAVIVLFENYRKGKLNDLRATVKTYFYGIAKNIIFVYLKKQSRQTAYTDVFPDADSADVQHCKEMDAAQEWTDNTIEIINRAVESLPAKGQEIIHLFYYEKKSLREITGILKYSSENVVKTTKMRYKKALKQWIEKEMNRQCAA